MKFISAKNVGLLVAAGLIANTGTAMAADTPAPTTTKTHTPSSEIAAYKAGHAAAVSAFKSTIAAAHATKESAIKAAITPEAKAAAKSAFESSVTAAKATRGAAVAALGTKPTPTVKVAK